MRGSGSPPAQIARIGTRDHSVVEASGAVISAPRSHPVTGARGHSFSKKITTSPTFTPNRSM
jgi:hypothetical protein